MERRRSHVAKTETEIKLYPHPTPPPITQANVDTLAYQLGVHAIVAFAPTVALLPPLWTFLAIIIHLGGTAAFHSRVKVRRKQDYDVAGGVVPKFILCEFTPLALQPLRDLEWRNEHVWFYRLT